MRNNNRVKVVNPIDLPGVSAAIQMYQQAGGNLRDPHSVGTDALTDVKRGIRNQVFSGRYPSFELIFSRLVNGDSTMFRNALICFIDITYRLSSS